MSEMKLAHLKALIYLNLYGTKLTKAGGEASEGVAKMLDFLCTMKSAFGCGPLSFAANAIAWPYLR